MDLGMAGGPVEAAQMQALGTLLHLQNYTILFHFS